MHSMNSILHKVLSAGRKFFGKRRVVITTAAVFLTAGIFTDALVYGNSISDNDLHNYGQTAESVVTSDRPDPEYSYEIPEEETFTESEVLNQVKSEIKLSGKPEAEADEDKVVKETETKEEKPEPVISYTEEDYGNFLKIVEAEATGGDIKSKILVANVIINRVKRNDFPNSVTEVIFQGNGEQFQPVMDGRFYKVKVTASTTEAVNRALYGEDYSMGATFFAALSHAGEGSWHASHLTRLFEYGGHVFFVN